MENYTDSLLSQTELLLMSAWYAREFNALLDPEGFLFCLTAMSEGYITIEWHPQAATFKYNRFNTLKQSHIFRRPILPICGGEYTATATTHSYIHVGHLQWTGSLPHVTTFDIRSHVTQYNIFLALYRRLPLQNGEHKLFDIFNRDAKYTDERLDSPKPPKTPDFPLSLPWSAVQATRVRISLAMPLLKTTPVRKPVEDTPLSWSYSLFQSNSAMCLMDKLLQVSLILMAWVVCLRNIWNFLSRRNASSPKAGATPVSITPISKAQTRKLADARMTGAALGGAFKRSVLEGQHHYQGFATQTSWTSTSQKFASHRPKMFEYGVAIMYIRAAKLSLTTSRFNRMISMNGGAQPGNIIVPSDYTLFKYHWPVSLADVEEPIENPLEFSLESFRNCFVEDE
ncbi:hypothetical protein AtubIFM55763_005714 [Aspergillus tubingensis]|uniref:Uncharacterized protein n=1 Tax=Aspergillus tubingensis TaxID=5068 RepID=A0A9W6AHR0_ASPTU|nr:hypothetical protein AtubIFM55763_005714 [Aspergillus tubingensis]GLA82615.1 hypothetical protein AtubIFM56815_006802 [Aspergillus tubingensis]